MRRSERCLSALERRGVSLDDLVECARFLHGPYEDIKDSTIASVLVDILDKREVANALLCAIELDELCERDLFSDKTLQEKIMYDDGLFGVDEVLAYGICNIYGSIALTNFGYIDKVKPGIIGKLNERKEGVCNTFLDDIVGALAASAASRMAHEKGS